MLLTGPSGAGKSTLLRAVAGLLLTASDGDLTGEVLIEGVPVVGSAERPAMLFQDPLAGVVADTVGRDVAFGLENLGVPRERLWPAVHESLRATDFPYGPLHPTAALSGGESQRLALAGSLVLGSRVLLLDEPISMLDPVAAASVQEAVRRHLDLVGPTTIVVDHQIEPWLSLVDRLVVMDRDGCLVADGEPAAVLAESRDSLLRQGVWVPGADPPALDDVPPDLAGPWLPVSDPDVLLRGRGLGLVLTNRLTRRREPPSIALESVNADVRAGRAVAVTGPSGSGKSSLVNVLAGLRRPTSGQVVAAAGLATRRRGRAPARWSSRDLATRLAWVPQMPEQGVVADTVLDEVLASSRACGRDQARSRERAEALLELMELDGLAAASPYHLSGGEQRRMMVAAALAAGPAVVLCDEPTVGQDRLTWAAVLGALGSARTAGTAITLATHDDRAVSALADDRIRLDRGRRVA